MMPLEDPQIVRGALYRLLGNVSDRGATRLYAAAVAEGLEDPQTVRHMLRNLAASRDRSRQTEGPGKDDGPTSVAQPFLGASFLVSLLKMLGEVITVTAYPPDWTPPTSPDGEYMPPYVPTLPPQYGSITDYRLTHAIVGAMCRDADDFTIGEFLSAQFRLRLLIIRFLLGGPAAIVPMAVGGVVTVGGKFAMREWCQTEGYI